jgi:hypothetical protein
MGMDHTKLTFRHNGVDRRLTDVHGEVVEGRCRLRRTARRRPMFTASLPASPPGQRRIDGVAIGNASLASPGLDPRHAPGLGHRPRRGGHGPGTGKRYILPLGLTSRCINKAPLSPMRRATSGNPVDALPIREPAADSEGSNRTVGAGKCGGLAATG